MAVRLPFAGLTLAQQLVRFTQRRLSNGNAISKGHTCRTDARSFVTSLAKRSQNEEEGDSVSSSQLSARRALLSRRRRSLSPLERISGLLPEDALGPDVTQLRDQNQEGPAQVSDVSEPGWDEAERSHQSEASEDLDPSDPSPEEGRPRTLPGETLLQFGELLVAEHRRKRQVEFRKMFQLQPAGRLLSNWGVVLHDDVVGQPAGRFLKTSRGVSILVRRPSLEDYVLYMKRGPNIAYPKDAATMLVMMDVTEGDRVLESGSGSGAMSLFLSRAVGSRGSVLSVELRDDHHRVAVKNYNRWRASWRLRRGEEWPDNVHFAHADLCSASSLLAGQGFNAAALDLSNPHLALPVVTPRLHPGAVCAVYLANITQVIDLLEGLRCLDLPLLCERIIEVPVRDWLVAAALQKDGAFCSRKSPLPEDERTDEGDAPDEAHQEETASGSRPAFGSVPYIARPHPQQKGHTAFLVRLRKIAH